MKVLKPPKAEKVQYIYGLMFFFYTCVGGICTYSISVLVQFKQMPFK